jgi:prephenate dehydrogenase
MGGEPARRPSSSRVVIVGGGGEFGRFLREQILPALGLPGTVSVERDTPAGTRAAALRRARHVVLATPLVGYPETAAELARELLAARTDGARRVTLWLLPSVHLPTLEAVLPVLSGEASGRELTAVLVHPMYGPHGFSRTEREARTFRNFVTAVLAPRGGRAGAEVRRLAAASERLLGIGTTRAIDPAAHDRITGASQGLSYCVAATMFDDPVAEREVAAALPELHRAFRADRGLILEFLRANPFACTLRAEFEAERSRSSESVPGALGPILSAFAAMDRRLNPTGSPIPTRWYERLQQAARERRV